MPFFVIEECHWMQLMSSLRNDFPLAKYMWQVVKDVQDGRVDAKIFTDQWPNFTTVVTQEFRPRISEIADLRIYTKSYPKYKKKAMEILNEANLLEKKARWQLINYCTSLEDSEDMSSYILKSLRQHPSVKEKTVSLIYDAKFFHYPNEEHAPFLPLPPGYMVRDILPEHIEYMAEVWRPGSIDYPMEDRVRFMKELLSRGDVSGGFTIDDPSKPISWIFRKPGGVYGMSYTMKEHRYKSILAALWLDLARKPQEIGQMKSIEKYTSTNTVNDFFELIGQSHNIAIHAPDETIASKL